MKIFNSLFCKSSIPLTKFHEYIVKIIKNTGPMNINNYMREMLTHPDHGYYINRYVFGADGDFITSPEISQMFGELIGIWIYNEWNYQQKPQPFHIVELGPGRGSLMNDALIAISKFPELFQNLSIKLVEVSEKLRKTQQISLQNCFQKLQREVPIDWFDDLNQIPTGVASCFIAHEFFDALPIHKFKRNSNGKWREILVDQMSSISGDNSLRFVLANKDTLATLAFKNVLDQLPSFLNDFEFSPISLSILDSISIRIIDDGGFAMIADYGHSGEKGDTLRAFKNHKLSDPLENLGESDITADVNFGMLASHLNKNFTDKLFVNGPISQNVFLRNMGINVRLQMLLKNCKSKAESDSLIWSYKMMMDPQEMGDRFKFLSILPALVDCYHNNYLPAGFCDLV